MPLTSVGRRGVHGVTGLVDVADGHLEMLADLVADNLRGRAAPYRDRDQDRGLMSASAMPSP
jgi:hypothetical protein